MVRPPLALASLCLLAPARQHPEVAPFHEREEAAIEAALEAALHAAPGETSSAAELAHALDSGELGAGSLALVLERRILQGCGAEVTRLLARDDGILDLSAALGAHAVCLGRAASRAEIPEALATDAEADPAERYLARCREADALGRAGLHVSARVHAVAALEILADADEPARQLSECERLLGEAGAFCVDAGTRSLLRGALLVRAGEAHKALFEYESALVCLGEATRLLGERPRAPWYAFAEDQLGWTCATTGRQADAIAAFRRAARAALACADADRLARVLRSLAVQHQRVGETDEALRRVGESIEVAARAGLGERRIESLLYRASILAGAGDLAGARASMRLASELGGGGPLARPALEQIRLRVQYTLERAADPRAPLSDALAADAERLVPRLTAAFARLQPVTWLAMHHLRRGDADAALPWIEETERISGDQGLPRTTPILLRALHDARLGRHDESLEGFGQVTRDLDEDLAGFEELGFERRFPLIVSAEEAFEHAVAVAADAYERTGEDRFAFRALHFFDHGRVRNLRQLAGLPPDVATYPPAGEDDAKAFPRRFDLAPDEVLLVFELDLRLAIALKGGEIRLFRTPDVAVLDDAVRFLLHALVEEPDAESYAAHARRLGGELLAPLEDWLREGGRMLCSSDGPLRELPLDFLLVPGEPNASDGDLSDEDPSAEARFDTLPFLFRRFSIVHAPGLPARTGPSCPVRYETALAFAHTDPADRLSAPALELELLERLFGRKSVLAVSPGKASEARFKRIPHPAADVLHVSGHVVADRERGGSSCVWLGEGEGEDGRLDVRELVALDLGYPLVVVAGCEGAAGQPLAAEGVLSIGWGLLAGGAHRVIVCSSEIEDALALRWMKAFYTRLREGHDPAFALRDARRDLLESGDPEDVRAALLPFHLWRAPR